MTAYLSKIAARFTGPSVAPSTQPANSVQALQPSATTFGNRNPIDSSFPFFTAPQSPVDSEEPAIEASEQNANTGQQILNPRTHTQPPASFESIRTIIHTDFLESPMNVKDHEAIEPATSATNIIQQNITEQNITQTIAGQSKSELKPDSPPAINVRSHEQTPLSEPIKPQDITDPQTAFSAPSKLEAKQSRGEDRSDWENEKKVKKTIEPQAEDHRAQKMQPQFTKNILLQKEVLSPQQPLSLLRPSNKKQQPSVIPNPNKSNTPKLRIGSIKVEILPATPPAVKTIPQQPQRTLASRPAPSSNPTRFPGRFGLGQL